MTSEANIVQAQPTIMSSDLHRENPRDKTRLSNSGSPPIPIGGPYKGETPSRQPTRGQRGRHRRITVSIRTNRLHWAEMNLQIQIQG